MTAATLSAIDVGINKLIATSDARAIGQDWRQISARVRRRRPGSKDKRRARIARDHSINHAVKQLTWRRLSAIGFEDGRSTALRQPKGRRKVCRKSVLDDKSPIQGVSPYRLRSHRRFRFHRRSKHFDQDPCGKGRVLSPRQQMSVNQ